MLLALALMLTAPDHWFVPAMQAVWDDHGVTAAAAHPHDDNEVHGRHCHGKAATCSDMPLTAIGGLALLAAWIGFAATSRRSFSASATWRRLAGIALDVTAPPPRVRVSAA